MSPLHGAADFEPVAVLVAHELDRAPLTADRGEWCGQLELSVPCHRARHATVTEHNGDAVAGARNLGGNVAGETTDGPRHNRCGSDQPQEFQKLAPKHQGNVIGIRLSPLGGSL